MLHFSVSVTHSFPKVWNNYFSKNKKRKKYWTQKILNTWIQLYIAYWIGWTGWMICEISLDISLYWRGKGALIKLIFYYWGVDPVLCKRCGLCHITLIHYLIKMYFTILILIFLHTIIIRHFGNIWIHPLSRSIY